MCNFASRKQLVEIRQTSAFSLKKETSFSDWRCYNIPLQYTTSKWYIDELKGTVDKANQEWLFIASHSSKAVNKALSRYKWNLLHFFTWCIIKIATPQPQGVVHPTEYKPFQKGIGWPGRTNTVQLLNMEDGKTAQQSAILHMLCSWPAALGVQYVALWSLRESLDNQWRDYQTVSVISAAAFFEASHGCLAQPGEVMVNK